ncbi:MAG: hypothetical protein ABH846_04605 [Patescibacteria group bacterium]
MNDKPKFEVIQGGAERISKKERQQEADFNQILERNSSALEDAGLNLLEDRVLLKNIFDQMVTNPDITPEEMAGEYDLEKVKAIAQVFGDLFNSPEPPPANAGAMMPEVQNESDDDLDQRMAA